MTYPNLIPIRTKHALLPHEHVLSVKYPMRNAHTNVVAVTLSTLKTHAHENVFYIHNTSKYHKLKLTNYCT